MRKSDDLFNKNMTLKGEKMKIEMSAKIDKNNTDEIKQAVNEQLLKALETIGLVAEGYAIKKAPYKTNRLRGSITHGVSEEEKCAYIGTNVEYAPYVEYGTTKMKPRPFLKPAVVDHIAEYKQIMEEELRNM